MLGQVAPADISVPRVRSGGASAWAGRDKADEVEIIGVVRDAKDIELRTETPSHGFLPIMQVPV